MPTVSSVIAAALAEQPTLTHCFGVMGNGNAYLLDALADTPVRYVAVRHESAAVAAADAFYRISGRIAVATTTYGPGFSNTLTSLAEAVQARTPLLLVVADQPTGGPRPWDVDQTGIADAVGAPTFTVSAADAGGTTIQALQYAVDYCTAVVLAIPYDLVTAETESPRASSLVYPVPVPPNPAAIQNAAKLLAHADRPLILAGRGAWLAGAGAAIGRLAGRIGALTATTAGAPGVIDPPGADGVGTDLGICGGFAGNESAQLIAAADVVLVAGAGLNPFTMRHQTAFGADATVIQIDVTEQPTHPIVDHYIRADARLATEALLGVLEEQTQPARNWPEQGKLPDRRPDPGTGQAADGRLDPRTIAQQLNDILPADRTVVTDGGHFIGWAPTFWQVRGPNRMIFLGTAYQTIGLGFATDVGAGAAAPDSTIVLTTGDGGALMGLADLESMIRTVASGVIVVWNDGYYGAELHQYGPKGLTQEPMRTGQADFAALGQALGADGAVIAELADLEQLDSWVDAGARGVFVADCRVSPDVEAPYMTTQLALAEASDTESTATHGHNGDGAPRSHTP
jgi:thiamine pyrophosphate-dependent acetolactate synthase large subunit-like protein